MTVAAAVEAYFADLGRVRASGGGTGERSSYAPLAHLLDAVGATLEPKVFCVGELADQGAGHPDFGLYTAKQAPRGRGRPRAGQTPERGVVEVKAADDDAWLTTAGDQVSRYWSRYRLVLVTNTRDFVLVGEDAAGRAFRPRTPAFPGRMDSRFRGNDEDGGETPASSDAPFPGAPSPDAPRGIGSDGDGGGPSNPGSERPSRVARRTEGGVASLRLEPRPSDHTVGRISNDDDGPRRRPNPSASARRYLEHLDLSVEDLFHHVLAVLHDPAYREANAGALRMEWPRIPLPGWPTLGNGTPGNGASDDAGVCGRNAPAATDRRSARPVPPAVGHSATPGPSFPRKRESMPLGNDVSREDTDASPATDQGSGAEGPPPGKAGVSPTAARSALPTTPAGETPAFPGRMDSRFRGNDEDGGETPAFPGGPPAHENHAPAVEPVFPGVRTPRDTSAPPADEPDPDAREPRTAPSGQIGRREAAEALARSAPRGRELARLLDSDTPVPGVTTGTLRPEVAAVAVPSTTDGRNMAGDDFALTAGWGHVGAGGAVMPGQGRIVERAFTPDERAALGGALPALGQTTFDVCLNARAFWRNVPAAVWRYKLGGYQVLKKWLSYREASILGRPLRPEEVQHLTDTARRIAAILPVCMMRSDGSGLQ